MPARVRLGGVPLSCFGRVTDLTDSTIYRTDGWSGDYQASCTFTPLGRDRDFVASWFRVNAPWQTVEAGGTTWGGELTEPVPQDDGSWLLTANGYGAELANFPAVAALASPPTGAAPFQSSGVPSAAVDYAHANLGLRVQRYGNYIDGVTAGVAGVFRSLDELLQLGAKYGGSRYVVDSKGELYYVSDPVKPTWQMLPGEAHFATSDESYYSALAGFFVYHLNASGVPDQWYFVQHVDGEMATQNGAKWGVVDLTALGLISASSAQQNVDGRFAVVGARTHFAGPVTLTARNFLRPGFGAGNPLSVRAGDMLRVPDVIDTRSSASRKVTQDVILGEVHRYHTPRAVDAYAVATPIGPAPRDFEAALAPAEAPTLEVA